MFITIKSQFLPVLKTIHNLNRFFCPCEQADRKLALTKNVIVIRKYQQTANK